MVTKKKKKKKLLKSRFRKHHNFIVRTHIKKKSVFLMFLNIPNTFSLNSEFFVLGKITLWESKMSKNDQIERYWVEKYLHCRMSTRELARVAKIEIRTNARIPRIFDFINTDTNATKNNGDSSQDEKRKIVKKKIEFLVSNDSRIAEAHHGRAVVRVGRARRAVYRRPPPPPYLSHLSLLRDQPSGPADRSTRSAKRPVCQK